MKILYHHRIASRDGGSTHIEEMIKAFRALGHSVTLVAPSPAKDGGAGTGGGAVALLRSHLPKAAYESMELAYSVLAYRKLKTAIQRERPDFIYERYNMLLPAGVWASRRFGIPIVVEVNAPFALERAQFGGLALPAMAERIERWVWRGADIVLPVSAVLAEHVRAAGVPDNRIAVIPNAIDPAAFAALPSRDDAKAAMGLQDRFVIGFTGFVRDWDRLDRVVSWISAYRGAKNLHLLVVGDGPARKDIEACAAQLGIADRVSFSGVLPRQDVARAARCFDIALQTNLVPYISPLCLFEYLALGVAIAAPDQPNHRELVQSGKSALLYDTEDPRGLESCLETLCQSDDLRERIAAAGPGQISSRRFTWHDNAQRVVELVSRCAH